MFQFGSSTPYVLTTSLTAILTSAQKNYCAVRRRYLHNLEVKKASGMDGISAHMLKATAHSIAPGITQLFNISIRLGRIPDLWKDARVTPIPKGGDSTDPRNYRPISLLSILSKLLEHHMYAVITSHLNSSCPLSHYSWKIDNWCSCKCH